jgi:hypothetical protein
VYKKRRMISGLLEGVCKEVVRACGAKYNFEGSGLEFRVILGVGLVPMPFVGVMEEGCCHGLKRNHGLLTQCTREKSGDLYCTGCLKEAEKNSSGKPNNGSIEDRMAAYSLGKEYRDPKGKTPISYIKVMEKLKLSEEDVKKEAKMKNVELPSDIFTRTVSKRGRPKKTETVRVDSSEPKRRGRPKKTGKPLEVSTTEDLFATLISEAKAKSPTTESKEPIVEKPPREEDKSESEEVKVKKFEFKGRLYYRTADNVLYDPKTQDCVGVFNEERQEIDDVEEEEEEEED